MTCSTFIECILLLFVAIANSDCQDVRAAFPSWTEQQTKIQLPSNGFPKWLNGAFYRQVCGAYGNISAPSGYRIQHLFDCLAGVAAYSFSDGKVSYQYQYYKTKQYDIATTIGQKDISKSSVGWDTLFSDMNIQKLNEYKNMKFPHISLMPSVDFWNIGNKLAAVTESPYNYELDPETLEQKMFPFTDTNMGVPGSFQDAPAHPVFEADGTIYNQVIQFDPIPNTQLLKAKSIAATIPLQNVDLANCNGAIYNDAGISQFGYLHSITMTENYIILPVTSLMISPCSYTDHPPLPGIKTYYQYYPNVPLKMILYHKQTSEIRELVFTEDRFVTHQFNAFEDPNGNIIADLLTYRDSKPYHEYTYVDRLLLNAYAYANLERFTINPVSGTVQSRILLMEKMEFSAFNFAYTGMPYQFGYAAQNPFTTYSAVIKIRIGSRDASISQRFKPNGNVILGEPQFVQEPGKTGEDDGVIIVGGANVDTSKGMIFVLDAKTLNLIAQSQAPQMTPPGLHNRFYWRSTFDANTSDNGSTLTKIKDLLEQFRVYINEMINNSNT